LMMAETGERLFAECPRESVKSLLRRALQREDYGG
jgi:hypothetical protein